MTEQPIDRLEIRELIENWIVWRDAGTFTSSAAFPSI